MIHEHHSSLDEQGQPQTTETIRLQPGSLSASLFPKPLEDDPTHASEQHLEPAPTKPPSKLSYSNLGPQAMTTYKQMQMGEAERLKMKRDVLQSLD